MKAYKFVSGDVADRVAAGSVRLPSAEEVRAREKGDAGFGDRSELATEATIAGGQEIVPGDHPAFAGSFVSVRNGVVTYPDMTIVGETVSSIEDALLYCCSMEYTPELRSRMLSSFGADVVFEIKDVEEFGRILDERLELSNRQFEQGPIHYTGISKGASARELEIVDPLRKDVCFAWQKEYRLLWAGKFRQKSLIVDEPRLAPLLVRLT